MSSVELEYTCSRDYHLFSSGPKRILALDGGGLRGAISVAFLERIEKMLDDHYGRKVRLADFFDLVGGTSTGAIIAGAVALGYPSNYAEELLMPSKRVEPNQWYFVVDCANCTEPIPFLEAPSPEEEPELTHRTISDLQCPRCEHVDTYAPALMYRAQGPETRH